MTNIQFLASHPILFSNHRVDSIVWNNKHLLKIRFELLPRFFVNVYFQIKYFGHF